MYQKYIRTYEKQESQRWRREDKIKREHQDGFVYMYIYMGPTMGIGWANILPWT